MCVSVCKPVYCKLYSGTALSTKMWERGNANDQTLVLCAREYAGATLVLILYGSLNISVLYHTEILCAAQARFEKW